MSDAWTDARLLTKEEVAEIEARKAASKQAAMQSLGTITKHLRVSVDFHITIAGTPPDDDGMNDPASEICLQSHAHNVHLLEVVKRTTVLEDYIRSLIALELEFCSWHEIDGGEKPLAE